MVQLWRLKKQIISLGCMRFVVRIALLEIWIACGRSFLQIINFILELGPCRPSKRHTTTSWLQKMEDFSVSFYFIFMNNPITEEWHFHISWALFYLWAHKTLSTFFHSIPELLGHFRAHRNQTIICKPDAGCQGKGIFLVRNLKKINPFVKLIAQIYIPNVSLLILKLGSYAFC